MVEVAATLFQRDGYVITTVEAVAADAGVSAKTVYDAFGTKGSVLRAVWDFALKGDLDEAPVADRPWYVAMLEERDPRRVIKLLASASVAVKQRIGPTLRVIRAAAVVDDDSASLWQLIGTDFHANQRVVVEHLAQLDALKPGLTSAKATDVLWTLNHPDIWLLLHDERGWSARDFERWLASAATTGLLRD